MPPLVYIVILNFNSWSDTFECVDSCCGLNYDNYRILLIDNGSDTDRSQELLIRHPGIEFVKNGRNSGFAAGCNQGIRHALERKADFVWLLNNDTVVDKESLSALMSAQVELDKVGVVSPKIYFHGVADIWSSGGYINRMGMACNYTDDLPDTRAVGFVTGCAMLVPSGMFRQYGLFKDDYFLNVEDWEFCKRVTDQGEKIYVVGSSVIHHKVSRSKKGGVASAVDVYYTTRNRLCFIDEYYRNPRKMFIFMVFAVWWPIWLFKKVLSGEGAIVKPFLCGVVDYYRGVKGACHRY